MIGSKISNLPEKTVLAIATFLCLLFTLNGIIVQVYEVPLHVIRAVNEGFNAYFAQRAMSGIELYPRPPAYLLNNYPPLSFYVIGPLGALIGDFVVAGRIISVLSLFTVAALLGYITGRQAGSRRLGLFIAAYFLAMFSVFPGERIGLNDPQLLGHAVMLGGLAILWFAEGRGFRLLLAAALMVAGGFIKHNLVALPLAVTLWLALTDRALLWRWLAAAAIALAVAGLLQVSIWGVASVGDILAARPTSLAKSFSVILILREILPALTIVLLLLFYPQSGAVHKRNVLFCVLYGVISTAAAFYFFGGIGVGSNAAFDVAICTVLGIGLLLGTLPSGGEKTSVIAALIIAQFVMIPTGAGTILNGSVERATRSDGADIRYLAEKSGPVICDDPTLCYWSGHPFLFDFFNLPLEYQMKKRDPEVFFRELRNRKYAVVAVDNREPAELPWFVSFRKELDASYRLDRKSEKRLFYVPK